MTNSTEDLFFTKEISSGEWEYWDDSLGTLKVSIDVIPHPKKKRGNRTSNRFEVLVMVADNDEFCFGGGWDNKLTKKRASLIFESVQSFFSKIDKLPTHKEIQNFLAKFGIKFEANM